MRIVRVVVAITAFGLAINVSTDTFGHDTHSHNPRRSADKYQADATSRSRMWTIKSLTGDRTPTMVKATLLTADHDQVRLQTLDGRVISTSIKTLTAEDLKFVHQRQERMLQLNTIPFVRLTAFQSKDNQVVANPPALANFFKPFAKTIRFHWDRDFLFVESTGMPDHPMMTGITAWQQQVPIPQAYTGNNAWKIPLHPVPAQNPMSTKEHFFRGAIALAVNGVPIFNPIKNNGKTDTLLAGELDRWGGHCGRADDYHYHIAPVHLEKIVGAGNPVAVALDGYAIYGYNDPNGKPPTDLDWLNGHKGPDGTYHYHATKTFPYLNGGFYGEVIELNGQVDPQPRAQGVRPALPGLKGAKIVGYENPKPDNFIVRYEVFGDRRSIEYEVADNGLATFNFVSAQGIMTKKPIHRASVVAVTVVKILNSQDHNGPRARNHKAIRDAVMKVVAERAVGELGMIQSSRHWMQTATVRSIRMNSAERQPHSLSWMSIKTRKFLPMNFEALVVSGAVVEIANSKGLVLPKKLVGQRAHNPATVLVNHGFSCMRMRSISIRIKSSAVKKSLVKQAKPLLDTTPTMTESLVKTNFRDGVDHEVRWAVLSKDTRKKLIVMGMGWSAAMR